MRIHRTKHTHDADGYCRLVGSHHCGLTLAHHQAAAHSWRASQILQGVLGELASVQTYRDEHEWHQNWAVSLEFAIARANGLFD